MKISFGVVVFSLILSSHFCFGSHSTPKPVSMESDRLIPLKGLDFAYEVLLLSPKSLIELQRLSKQDSLKCLKIIQERYPLLYNELVSDEHRLYEFFVPYMAGKRVFSDSLIKRYEFFRHILQLIREKNPSVPFNPVEESYSLNIDLIKIQLSEYLKLGAQQILNLSHPYSGEIWIMMAENFSEIAKAVYSGINLSEVGDTELNALLPPAAAQINTVAKLKDAEADLPSNLVDDFTKTVRSNPIQGLRLFIFRFKLIGYALLGKNLKNIWMIDPNLRKNLINAPRIAQDLKSYLGNIDGILLDLERNQIQPDLLIQEAKQVNSTTRILLRNSWGKDFRNFLLNLYSGFPQTTLVLLQSEDLDFLKEVQRDVLQTNPQDGRLVLGFLKFLESIVSETQLKKISSPPEFDPKGKTVEELAAYVLANSDPEVSTKPGKPHPKARKKNKNKPTQSVNSDTPSKEEKIPGMRIIAPNLVDLSTSSKAKKDREEINRIVDQAVTFKPVFRASSGKEEKKEQPLSISAPKLVQKAEKTRPTSQSPFQDPAIQTIVQTKPVYVHVPVPVPVIPNSGPKKEIVIPTRDGNHVPALLDDHVVRQYVGDRVNSLESRLRDMAIESEKREQELSASFERIQQLEAKLRQQGN